MSSDHPAASSQQPFAHPQPAPVPPISHAASPPTRQSLKAWWKGFRPQAKNQETHGNAPSLDIQSFVALETYYTSEGFVSKLPKDLPPVFQENTMNGAVPVIDGLPREEASPASPPQQDTIVAPALEGQLYGDASQASPPQLTNQKCFVFKAFSGQKLLRASSRQHSSSILSHASNQGNLQQDKSSTNVDAKPCFALTKEDTSSPSGTLVAGQDGEGNTPRGAGILPNPKKETCLRFLDSSPLSLFIPRFFFVKIAKYFKTVEQHGIFGVPLRESIGYANVAISLVDAEGKSYIYGYVPIVVAKCGVYLKEKATNVEGIFRLSGSEKRIKELRAIFDSPERYGKGLDWAGYTVHDAANVLRRYLNLLPEPIVPLNLYERFRDPLRGHTKQAVGDNEGPQLEDGFDVNQAIVTYQQLITELPPLNRQLLLYILDLLAVFASKSDENRMNSQNLAAIFQPGMLSHPLHDMAPAEYRLSQDVLIFLIENQDHFLIGMRGTAADEKTVQEVQSAGTPPLGTPATPSKARNSVARSSSNASAGADSVRKYGGVRRNVSVSSRNSRQSNGGLSPSTPTYGGSLSAAGGVHRSNTVPSKKSPGLPQGRMQKNSGPPSPLPVGISAEPPAPRDRSPAAPPWRPDTVPSPLGIAPAIGPSSLAPSSHAASAVTSQEKLLGDQLEKQPEVLTPSKERNISSFFQRSPTGEIDKKPPNKLRKRRIPSSNPSAQSSTNSLHGPQSNSVSPGLRPDRDTQDIPEHPQLESIQSMSPIIATTPTANTAFANTELSPTAVETPRAEQSHFPPRADDHLPPPEQTLKPKESPVSSIHSRSSFNDQSDLDRIDDPAAVVEQKEKRSRWRISRRKDDLHGATLSPQRAIIGSDTGAGTSTSSIGSSAHPRKSFTGDTVPVGPESTLAITHLQSSNESNSGLAGPANEEKKGPLGWIKNKMREKREEKEAEKDRTKSPPASTERLAARGKSMDIKREDNPERIAEEPSLPQTEPPPQ